MKIEIEVKSVKMLREALCLASHAANEYSLCENKPSYRHAGYKVEDLIMELDKHRPLGSDGKHGDKHTATCGCEDNPVLAVKKALAECDSVEPENCAEHGDILRGTND